MTATGVPATGDSGRASQIPSSAVTAPTLTRYLWCADFLGCGFDFDFDAGFAFLAFFAGSVAFVVFTPWITILRVIVSPWAPPVAAIDVTVRTFDAPAELRTALSTPSGIVKRRSLLPARSVSEPSDVEPIDALTEPSPLDSTISRSCLSVDASVISSGP